jgi:hypothetical protein
LRGRIALCAVCTVHVETSSAGFLIETQNQSRRFEWFGLQTTRTVFPGLASKPVVTVFSGLTSKPLARVSRFGPQNRQLRFSDLGLKITVTVSWFGTQNHVGFGSLVALQNRRREGSVGHVSRSGDLLHMEASHARVS